MKSKENTDDEKIKNIVNLSTVLPCHTVAVEMEQWEVPSSSGPTEAKENTSSLTGKQP